MKVIFSPTKSQSTDSGLLRPTSLSLFNKKTKFLLDELSKLSKAQLSKLLKISQSKADEVYEYHRNVSSKTSALELFNGISFKQLELQTYTKEQLIYAQQHLFVLSALYGVLRPLDQISCYRLDMNDTLLSGNSDYKSLYHFWSEEVAVNFVKEDVVLNLASLEYSKMLRHNYFGSIIDVHFLLEKNEEQKAIAVHSKIQRGKMLNYIIKNKIHYLKDLKKYSADGYVFNVKQSTIDTYIFIKKDM
jgi:cytoplasmic iron level regulating protein YaaA (DUF328/UPF0246 family)